MALKISEEAAVQMPMKTVASLICLVAIGTWAFFSIQETLNRHTTTLELMEKDLEQNSEFRIKYPRGELGQSSGEAELFMLVEHMSGQLEKIIEKQENSMHNKVNIDRLQKDVEKILENIENLKDKVRNNGTGTQ
jgi:uncharacterized membrane protein YraQ (UPF0718 family)